jgi:hypothetical protein
MGLETIFGTGMITTRLNKIITGDGSILFFLSFRNTGLLQHGIYGHLGRERAGDARRSRPPAMACENAADL